MTPSCNFAASSRIRCGPQSMAVKPLTLDELDEASMRVPGKKTRLSWMILSRIGVNFLQASHGRWTVCVAHKREFLDAWQVAKSCCHPKHSDDLEPQPGTHLVTVTMSVKMLQHDGVVVPISGKLCWPCKRHYDLLASDVGTHHHQGVHLPAAVVPSPFCFIADARDTLTPAASPLRRPEENQQLPEVMPMQDGHDEDIPVLRHLGLQRAAFTAAQPVQPAHGASTPPLPPDAELQLRLLPIVHHRSLKATADHKPRPDHSAPPRRRKVARRTTNQHSVQDERPSSGMSWMSNGSDDDPTWAPCPEATVSLQPAKRSRKYSAPDSDSDSRAEHRSTKKQPNRKQQRRRLRTPSASASDSSTSGASAPAQAAQLSPTEGLPLAGEDPEEQDSSKRVLSEVASQGNGHSRVDSTEFHYLCMLCHISFYRYTAYKHHMSSSAELHSRLQKKQLQQQKKKLQQSDLHLTCTVCKSDFKDRVSQQRHMAEEHGLGRHPFFCQMCNVCLKSEAAFKSHNSKLHLERRAKSYYCRECDEVFACKVKHRRHILSHQTWSASPDSAGMQCKICGKIFAKTQTLPFHRHLATHADDPDSQDCSCRDCAKKDGTAEDEMDQAHHHQRNQGRMQTRNLTKRGSSSQVTSTMTATAGAPAPKAKSTLLQQMQGKFSAVVPDVADQPLLSPFQCGVCSKKFAQPDVLAKHVTVAHSTSEAMDAALLSDAFDRITDDFVSEIEKERCADVDPGLVRVRSSRQRASAAEATANKRPGRIDAANLSRQLVDKSKIVHYKPSEKNWQECPERNWAAEFGYGSAKSQVSDDLLSKMRNSFGSGQQDSDDSDVEMHEELFRSRGLKGNVRASPAKEPRVLSKSSLRSRKRMESLLRRARSFMKLKEDEKALVLRAQEAEAEREAAAAASAAAAAAQPVATGTDGREDEAQPDGDELEQVVPLEKVPCVAASGGNRLSEEEGENGDDDDDGQSSDFDAILDADDDSDGLLIPLENGWVCEKNWVARSASYNTHFWSLDGRRHASLAAIKVYGERKHLNLDLSIFERALRNNPPRKHHQEHNLASIRFEPRTTRSKTLKGI